MAKLKHPLPVPASGPLGGWRETPRRADPRWRLGADPRLSPYIEYLLLVGEPPAGRVRGWVVGVQDETIVEDVWARHDDDLISEANFYEFSPFRLTGVTPSGERFEAWRLDFLKRHSY